MLDARVKQLFCNFSKINLYTIVVNIGHMLGLDQEREELGEKPVSYLYGDPSFKYVCSFVCV